MYNEFETKLKIKFTVLSKTTRILKLKRQLMFAFFTAINHLRDRSLFIERGGGGGGLVQHEIWLA